MIKHIRAIFFSLSIGGAFFCFANVASAATLFFSPSSGTYDVGKTFTVNVLVSSSDQAANAYSSTISFPSDVIEMTGIGKGGSVVNLWVQDPSYSAGSANFEGVTFNPGYKGGAGKIISLTFKAKAEGTAVIHFIGGSVLANDGEGTNILTGRGSATFTIGKGTPQPPTPPAEVVGKPAAPKISSPTHPDQNAWYAANTATFTWTLQNGVDAVNILADQIPDSDPGTTSDGFIYSHTYDNVKDGTWYFHLRVRNKNGWSPASHFRFQIDTVKPDSFTITENPSEDPSEITKSFTFKATDALSGIATYEVWIDSGATSTWVDDGSHVYRTPPVGPGAHVLHARAFDKAGNYLEASAPFNGQALAPPRITDYPRTAYSGDELFLAGNTYATSQVSIWVLKGGERAFSRQVMSDGNGRFTFTLDEKLEQGTYEIWATVTDSLGNTSESSKKITILVKGRPFDLLGWIARVFSGIWIWILLFWLLLLLLAYLLWRRYLAAKRVRKGVYGAQDVLHRSFDILRDDIQEQIRILEKASSQRKLTQEEGKILKRLKRDLKVAEQGIRKEIKDIGKDI